MQIHEAFFLLLIVGYIFQPGLVAKLPPFLYLCQQLNNMVFAVVGKFQILYAGLLKPLSGIIFQRPGRVQNQGIVL